MQPSHMVFTAQMLSMPSTSDGGPSLEDMCAGTECMQGHPADIITRWELQATGASALLVLTTPELKALMIVPPCLAWAERLASITSCSHHPHQRETAKQQPSTSVLLGTTWPGIKGKQLA